MVCLPEFYIYGWIFGIQSKKESLIKYKWECYKVLFDHFHGSITQRSKFLNLKSKQQAEIERLEAILMENKDYQKLQECRNQIKAANNSLSKLDHELIHGQMSLQFGNEN
jgi:septal ring factor EnvC (AmiA/AmiB activator)